MEDKRREELKNKIDRIDDLNEKIGACTKKMESMISIDRKSVV